MKCVRAPFLDVDVYFGTDMEDAKAFIRSKSTTPDEDAAISHCRGCCYTVTDAVGLDHRMMCVFAYSIKNVAHEAAHMARRLLRHCEIKHSDTNDEVFALTVEWLVAEMLRQFGTPSGQGDES